MTHEHDHDLIMALAEGAVDAADTEAAEASLAGCTSCREDLRLQREALAFLATAPSPAMTDLERARLRRAVRHNLPAQPTLAEPRPQKRFRLVTALGGVAAVLIAAVVIAPQLGSFGGDDANELIAADAPATEATAATEAPTAAESAEEDLTNLAASTDEVVEAPETLRDADPFLTQAYSQFDPADPPTLETVAAAVAAERREASLEPAPPGQVEGAQGGTAAFDTAACQDAARAALVDEGATLDQLVVGFWKVEGVDAAIVAYIMDDDSVVAVAHDAATCEVLERS